MYIRYAKDENGRILGAVVAIASNRIGFALANPKMQHKDFKKDLIAFAAAKAAMYSTDSNLKQLQEYVNKHDKSSNPTNVDFFCRANRLLTVFTELRTYSATSHILPTLVFLPQAKD